MGACPCRFGRANVVCPLPPNVVPSSANSAWFWLIGRNCPLHMAHPFGAKLKDMIRISARNGSATRYFLGPAYGHVAGAPPAQVPVSARAAVESVAVLLASMKFA